MNTEPYFENQEARLSIRKRFNWPYENWMQDWPLEISGKIDLSYCLQEYPNLVDKDEKFLLMRGILYAWDDDQEELFELCSKTIVDFLRSDFDIHSYTIYYWTCYDTDIEGFRITSLMQKVWNSAVNNKKFQV